MKKIILNCEACNIDDFERVAEFAKNNNITHVVVSEVEKSIWQWNKCRRDPYPNWGMYFSSIFKIIVPDELKKFIPQDYAERNLDMIVKRAEILKKYDLKAVFEGMEPAWLDEDVYREHPSWRGPRCDQPRRSRREYYAPCTDNPEVIKLYDESIYKLCSIVPIEYFSFLTNDSGGGMCWSSRLYPGTNGPQRCRHISVAERVTNFLSVVQNAAARAGVTAEAGFERFFNQSELQSIVPLLKDGQFCCGYTNKESAGTKIIGWFEYQEPAFPIANMPMPVRFAEMMPAASKNSTSNIYYRIPSPNSVEYFELIKGYAGKMDGSVRNRYQNLYSMAAGLIGEKYADKLVDVWDNINSAYNALKHLNSGGHIFSLGTVHQRWLTRPLVAFPFELSDEERAYYKDYLFQAGTEEESENLVNLQGHVWLSGYSSHVQIKNSSKIALSHISNALDILNELLACDDIIDYKDKITELVLKIRMYRCIINNAYNVIHFQSIMDRTDFLQQPQETIVKDEQGDLRLNKVNKIIRKEIENTYEMIDILDSAKTPVFLTSATEETEDIMRFGPNIRNDFLKKIDIMENHRYDFNRLYKSFNI